MNPTGPLPPPPAGFRVIEPDVLAEYRTADRLLETKPKDRLDRLDRVLQRMPGYTPALHLRGLAHLLRDESAAAVADLEQAVAGDPRPIYRLEHATAVKVAGDKARYLKLLVALRKDVDPTWEHFPELQCRIGVQRTRDGDKTGLQDVKAACDKKFAACCAFLKEK